MSDIHHLKVHWTSYSLHAAGYQDAYGFYDSLKRLYQVDNVAILVFANKEGRSYAQPANNNYPDKFKDFSVEAAVVYKNYFDNPAPLSAATIMHEMLHLYGAWDMYKSDERSYDLQRRVNSAFQHSIMIDTHEPEIKPFLVDQLTAWRVGWTKTYWPWYEMFRQTKSEKRYTSIPGVEGREEE